MLHPVQAIAHVAVYGIWPVSCYLFFYIMIISVLQCYCKKNSSGWDECTLFTLQCEVCVLLKELWEKGRNILSAIHFLLIAVNPKVLLWSESCPLERPSSIPDKQLPSSQCSLLHAPWAAKTGSIVVNTKKKKECWSTQYCVQDVEDVTVIFGGVCFILKSACTCVILCSSCCSWRLPLLFVSHPRHCGSHCWPPPRPMHHQGERHQCKQGEPCQCHCSCHCMQEVPATHTGEAGGE